MSKIIEKTVVSKYAPHDTNVDWLDVSGDKPVKKSYINGKWQVISGGGSDYPTPTTGDVNKVWQVTPVQKGTKTEETVIVPEQTLVDGQELEYNDKFVPGTQCVAVVNGVEYRGEVVEELNCYAFRVRDIGSFEYDTENEIFKFWNDTISLEVTAKLSVIEEVPNYDYNWAPGVKIPIPTAEDEGKILVVTKVAGDDASIIIPEQPVPADSGTTLTDIDLTKFVIGNTVKITITDAEEQGGTRKGSLKGVKSENSETFTATGIVEEDPLVGVTFSIDDSFVSIWQEDNLLYTNAASIFDTNSTIKLEYIESNYEYQLQENSGGDSSNNSGYAIKIPDNITLASPNSSSAELYCVYEHDDSPLEPGIYLAAYGYTVNGISFWNVYQIMINDENKTLLGSFVVNISDGGNLKAQSYDVYPIYPNKGGYFINIVYDNIQSAYFINIEYTEGAQE